MKIAHVTTLLSHEGAGLRSAVEALSSRQCKPGKDVRVFGIDNASWRDTDRHTWNGAPAFSFSSIGPPALGFAPMLLKGLIDFKPDIIHQHGLWTWPSAAVLWASRILKRPTVISPHGMLDEWALSQSKRKKEIALKLFESANLKSGVIHSLCAAETHSIRATGLDSPIATISNGVDMPVISTKGQSSFCWSDIVPRNAKVMLFLGRIHPKKGLPAFIKAMSQALQEIEKDNWHLVIAGWDQNEHRVLLEALINETGLASRVHFVGPLFGAQKSEAFNRASIFVLPSMSEGLPLAVLEAWAHRLPVLMTPNCNIPEGVAAGAAWEARPEQASLANVLLKVLKLSEDQLAEAGLRGKMLVAQRFSWTSISCQFDDLYDWLCQNNRDLASMPHFVSTA